MRTKTEYETMKEGSFVCLICFSVFFSAYLVGGNYAAAAMGGIFVVAFIILFKASAKLHENLILEEQLKQEKIKTQGEDDESDGDSE